MQSVEDVLLVGDRPARLVGVLEPQHERPARVARVQVVEQRRPGGPDMERTGRARGDPDARRGHRLDDGSGTRWKRPGSASPGRTRTSAAGRRPSVARPRGPSSVSESSDSLRARIVMWAPGCQRPRLEVGEQTGILLGLLGDPIDRWPGCPPPSRSGRSRRVGGGRSRHRSGLPCGQVSGCPSISSSRASTRGEIAPWRRIASSSDSAQPSPMTEVSSHSSSACRRKMPSAAARPAGVRWRSRPSACATSPSATSRRNISLAACVVTPRWRAICAAVTRPCVVGADQDAQGEQVLLSRGGQVALIVSCGGA